MVHKERAGTPKLKNIYENQLNQIKQESQKIVHNVPSEIKLKTEDQAVFYSSWEYSAVRMLTFISEFQNIDQISHRLNLSQKRVRQIVDFLIKINLCSEQDGRIVAEVRSTHLENNSITMNHHRNWKLKSLEKTTRSENQELLYTAPMSISKKDQSIIKKLLIDTVKKVADTAVESEPETLLCLNIDWFEI